MTGFVGDWRGSRSARWLATARPSKPPTDYDNLLHGLAVLWPSYLAYALTFLFIGQVWVNHHVMFDHIRASDRFVLLLSTRWPGS